jgi:hypothetical protein
LSVGAGRVWWVTEGVEFDMTRYVIGPDVAIRLAHEQAVIVGNERYLNPALFGGSG